MAKLEKKAQAKRAFVLAGFLIFSLCAIVELFMLFNKTPHFIISSLVFGLGVFGVLSLHWSFFKERQFAVLSLVSNLTHQKSKSVDSSILKTVVEKDVKKFLQHTHLLTPKLSDTPTEFERVEGFSDYIKEYKDHSDLNTLEEASKKVLENNKKLSFSFKELGFDFLLIGAPFLLVGIESFLSHSFAFGGLLLLRGVSLSFYMRSLHQAHKSYSFERLEHFLFGSLSDSEAFATRLKLQKLKEARESSVFFLIDSHRKNEVDKVLEFQTSGEGEFKDWAVISVGNSSSKNKAKAKNAFVVFPSEMGFPYNEMKDFFEAFEKVIIIDSSPSYALHQSAVFYLDHNQDIKRVHIDDNLERMSGDKGLILRNFKKHDVMTFFKAIEEEVDKNKKCYLVYECKKEDGLSTAPHFIYPSGCKVVSATQSLEGVEEGFYCDLGVGNKNEKLERAKNFVANCSYHQIYSGIAFENKMRKSFRVS